MSPCFIDGGVYTQRRLFRLVGSSKLFRLVGSSKLCPHPARRPPLQPVHQPPPPRFVFSAEASTLPPGAPSLASAPDAAGSLAATLVMPVMPPANSGPLRVALPPLDFPKARVAAAAAALPQPTPPPRPAPPAGDGGTAADGSATTSATDWLESLEGRTDAPLLDWPPGHGLDDHPFVRCRAKGSLPVPPPFEALAEYAAAQFRSWGGGANGASSSRVVGGWRYLRSAHPNERLLHLTAANGYTR